MCLQSEEWVAADVEDAGSPMFSDPLTIDELRSARDDFESSFHSASVQGAPAYAFLSACFYFCVRTGCGVRNEHMQYNTALIRTR